MTRPAWNGEPWVNTCGPDCGYCGRCGEPDEPPQLCPQCGGPVCICPPAPREEPKGFALVDVSHPGPFCACSGCERWFTPAPRLSAPALTDEEQFAEDFERAIQRADMYLLSLPIADDESMSAMLSNLGRTR